MLDINLVAVLTQAFAFIILAAIMAKWVFPPIAGMLDARRSEIESTLAQIRADRAAMETSRTEYEQRLAGIEAEARDRIAGAVKQAQEEAAGILAKGREEAAAQHERALAEIDQQRKQAIASIRAEMADLAVVAASKVLEREINPAVHRDLIGDFITQVGSRS